MQIGVEWNLDAPAARGFRNLWIVSTFTKDIYKQINENKNIAALQSDPR